MALTAFSAAFVKNEFPEENVVLSFGPYAAAGLANDNYFIHVFDRATDLEQITVAAEVAAASVGQTIRFWYLPGDGTSFGAGPTYITAATPLNAATAWTSFNVPFTGNQLDIPAGAILGFTTAGPIQNVVNLMITVRKKARRYRTDDAGNKHPVDSY